MNHEPIHILLADDDEDDRLFFREALAKIPMKTKVETVNDGVQLLEYLNNPLNLKPDLLFLDLNMPRKNGLQSLIEIRNTPALKDISIAIYSTSTSDKDIENAFVHGANIYINKPNNFGCLQKVLAKVLSVNWQYQTSGLDREKFLLSL
ncbi:response regulator [Echinicola sediminis]